MTGPNHRAVRGPVDLGTHLGVGRAVHRVRLHRTLAPVRAEREGVDMNLKLGCVHAVHPSLFHEISSGGGLSEYGCCCTALYLLLLPIERYVVPC